MKTATTVCGKCGAKISDDATGQLCPACLLETGLSLFDEEPVAGVVDPGRDAVHLALVRAGGHYRRVEPGGAQVVRRE